MAKNQNPNDETVSAPVKAPMVPLKDFRRGSETKRHRLFKLLPSVLKRNISYKYRKPDLVNVEHVHFFHTINDTTLQDNIKSSPMGGHFHECHVEYNNEGEVTGVKVGKPMRKFHRVLPNGEYVEGVEQVSFEEYDMEGNITKRQDEHSHEIEYHGFEDFNRESRNAFRAQNRRDVAGNVDGPVATQAAKMESLHTGKDKDEVRGNIRETAPKK